MNKKISFDNTEIAFSSMSNGDLTRAYWLFKAIGYNWVVKVGPAMTNFCMRIGLPIAPIIKATVFRHFCGGESIAECNNRIELLGKFKVGTILDYSVEGEDSEEAFDATMHETIATIKRAAADHANIPFSVFKVTGIARFGLLEKLDAKLALNSEETEEYARVKNRVKTICQTAYDHQVRIFIDAEESWIQETIDQLAHDMMLLFNKEKAMVFNTFQLYRHDRLEALKKYHQTLVAQGCKVGMKLVRGAYMEKERARAIEMNYPSPIQSSKENSDRDYDLALEYCIEHIDQIAVCAGTHNEQSSKYLVELMEQKGIANDDERVYFSQLLGMSDNLSYNLANAGYNVAKYVPYGPLKSVLPYLFRRAQENTAIAGQMGRELSLIVTERARRRK